MRPLQDKLLEKARQLPKLPGCYLMKNNHGDVLYIGKAKDLRSRVSSYFNQSAKSPKTIIMVGHVRDFEFILTKTDAEAFVLENNLIKKHAPKYNIRMRDDKSYPYVVVDYNEPFPRLKYQRRVKRKKGREVFGPFATGSNISTVLRILTKSFQLRDCSLREFHSRKEPCLLYQLHQCSAPCVSKITTDKYNEDLDMALNLLRGKEDRPLTWLEKKMHEHAEKEEFERAAMLRDNLDVLHQFVSSARQEHAELKGQTSSRESNIDVVAFYKGDIEVDVAIYIMRNGLLLGHKNFHFPVDNLEESLEDAVINFLFQYYNEGHDSLPQTIVLPVEASHRKLLQKGLDEVVEEKSPKVQGVKKEFRSLMELTRSQASEHQRVRMSEQKTLYTGLNRLKELLRLKERPDHLECYDVAIWQGKLPTAAQIVFLEGRPQKSDYRYYHLQEREEGNNDFAMMREVIERRLAHGHLPDIFIIDGGKGQVSSVEWVLKENNIHRPVVGVAKAKTQSNFRGKKVERSEERLIIPGRANPYILSKCPPLYRLLTQMRDEAHRFSRRLHHKAHKKEMTGSWLDQVKGVGPKRREKILRRLDRPIEDLKNLSETELSNLFEIPRSLAQNIKSVLEQM